MPSCIHFYFSVFNIHRLSQYIIFNKTKYYSIRINNFTKRKKNVFIAQNEFLISI